MQCTASPEKSLADIGDIAQDANNAVAKILLQCGKPELAAEVKSIIERLLILNVSLGAALPSQDRGVAGDLENLNALVHASAPSLSALSEMRTLILSKNVSDRLLAVAYVRGLVSMLAALGCTDVELAAEETSKTTVANERDVLLALVRGYRFVVEADQDDLDEHKTTRVQMLSRVRALEAKAAVSGIEC